jgi:hypothetical protein
MLCQECEKLFTPLAQVNHIEKTLREKHVPESVHLPEDQYKYCPDCRRMRVGAKILQVVRDATPYLTIGGD